MEALVRSMRAAFGDLSKSSCNKPTVRRAHLISALFHACPPLPQIHALSHVTFWIEEFGAMVHYNSSTFETNHIFDVKSAARCANHAANVRRQLLRMNKRHRVTHNARVLAARWRATGACVAAVFVSLLNCVCWCAGGARSAASSVTSSTAASAIGSTSTDDEGNDEEGNGQEQFTYQPKNGVRFAVFLAAHGDLALLPGPDAFLLELRHYLCVQTGWYDQRDIRLPYFRSLRDKSRWIDTNARRVSVDDIRFYTSPRATKASKGRRRYRFSVVASCRYRGMARFHTIFVKSDDDDHPFVAQVLALFDVHFGDEAHVLVYVRWFDPVHAADELEDGSDADELQHVLKTSSYSFDFIAIESLIEPAHVIPLFSTERCADDVGQRRRVLYDKYSSFRVCKDHFPSIV